MKNKARTKKILLDNHERQVLDLICSHDVCGLLTPKIADLLGINETKVKRCISKLIDLNLISAHGNGKARVLKSEFYGSSQQDRSFLIEKFLREKYGPVQGKTSQLAENQRSDEQLDHISPKRIYEAKIALPGPDLFYDKIRLSGNSYRILHVYRELLRWFKKINGSALSESDKAETKSDIVLMPNDAIEDYLKRALAELKSALPEEIQSQEPPYESRYGVSETEFQAVSQAVSRKFTSQEYLAIGSDVTELMGQIHRTYQLATRSKCLPEGLSHDRHAFTILKKIADANSPADVIAILHQRLYEVQEITKRWDQTERKRYKERTMKQVVANVIFDLCS